MTVALAGGAGAFVHVVDQAYAAEQFWCVEIAPQGGAYLHPKHNPNLCLEPYADDSQHNRRLRVWDCDGGFYQRFYSPGADLRPLADAAKCLDTSSDGNGVPVRLAVCTGGPRQFWI